MRIHMTAICGSAMANAALLFRALGHEVRGSDPGAYPPMSTLLATEGIEVMPRYDPAHLDGVDLAIVGNAVSRGNPEVEALLEGAAPFTSMPEALHRLVLRDRDVVAVTGTHGKTTTSSMLAWVLDRAGRDPGFLVGGIPRNVGAGARLGSGRPFVIEGDEYDTAFFDKVPKFLHYWPRRIIVTNVEFDHGDIYRDLADVQWAFQRLFRLIPASGCVVACGDSPGLREILPTAYGRVVTYGEGPENDVRLVDFEAHDRGVRWVVEGGCFDGGSAAFEMGLIGRHNALNATAVIVMAVELGVELEEIRRGLESFAGVARRQEVRGRLGGALVIDDYGHHPTALRETLDALRLRYPGKEIWLAFEFRSNTSLTDVFAEAYPEAMSRADRLFIGPPPKQRYADDLQRRGELPLDAICRKLGERGVPTERFERVEDLAERLRLEAGPQCVIAVMSSGSFGGLVDRLVGST